MKSLSFAFFSLRAESGCTSMAIHLANFFATEDEKVALMEGKQPNKEASYRFSVDPDDDGNYIFNRVRFIPADSETDVTEPIVITDIGEVGLLYEFQTYDKLYLCTDGRESDRSWVKEYAMEHPGFHPDVLLFGASKDTLRAWTNENFRSILLGKDKEAHIPQNFALSLGTFLRTLGITPPVYHSDAVYRPVPFVTDDVEETEKEAQPEKPKAQKKQKKLFFEKEKEISTETSDISVKNEPIGQMKALNYIDVPKPCLPEEKTRKEKRQKEREEKKRQKEEEKERQREEARKKQEEEKRKEAERKEKEREASILKQNELDDTEEPVVEETPSSSKETISLPHKPAPKKTSVFSAVGSFVHSAGSIVSSISDGKRKTNDVSVPALYENTEWKPYDGSVLKFDELLPAKDLKSYACFLTKDHLFFGLLSHAKGRKYKNDDNSLLVFSDTVPKDELLQFLTQDLLSGEFVLSSFSDTEQKAMTLYFSFYNDLFQKEMGKTLSISEYMNFKDYYNQLAELKFLLEEEQNEREVKAHAFCKKLKEYAALYNEETGDLTEQMLLENNGTPFLSLLEEIEEAHMVNIDAKTSIELLMKDIADFTGTPFQKDEPKETDYRFKALHDELTGLKNRSALSEDQVRFIGQDCAVLSIDADGLKRTNDLYGHKAGDLLITLLGEGLSACFGVNNVYRVGGDEFEIVLCHVSEADVQYRIDKFESYLSSQNERKACPTPLSVSIGIAFGTSDIDELYREADAKMYQNKQEKKGFSTERPDFLASEEPKKLEDSHNPFQYGVKTNAPEKQNELALSNAISNAIVPKNNAVADTTYNDDMDYDYEDGEDLLYNTRLAIICLDETGTQTDRATFAGQNYARAVRSFLHRRAYIKQLCVIDRGIPVLLFRAKNGGLISTIDCSEKANASFLLACQKAIGQELERASG